MPRNDEWPLVDEEIAKAAWGNLLGKRLRGGRSPNFEDFKDCLEAYELQSLASSKPAVDDQSKNANELST